MAMNAIKPHFPVGKREILFPKFTVTLIKSHLPPNFARFIVPLSFNKLDLRDYLFHAYAVRTLHVRSSITQGRASKNDKGQLKRDPPTKFMTAQLLEPFVWPAEPWVKEGVKEEEWDGFQRGTMELTEDADRGNEVALRFDKRMRSQGERIKPAKEHRDMLAEQADRLLSGRDRWRSTASAMRTEEFWRRGTGAQEESRTR